MHILNSLGLDIIIEEYIPLLLNLENSDLGNYCLSYGNNYSLLELKISAKYGMLIGISLVMAIERKIEVIPALPKRIEKGLPVFDLSLWEEELYIRIDRAVELTLLDDQTVLISIDREREADKVVCGPHLKFAIANGYPCWLIISDLSEGQMGHLKNHMSYS